MPFIPYLLAGAGSIWAWESVTGSADPNGSLLSWNNVIKIALVAGAAYLAVRALQGAR